MSIRALYYITGDTQQSGFRRIGSSAAFPADSLPYLNNGDPIQERARIESGSSVANSSGGIQTLSHVWEYQTGKYGCPVMINSILAIGTGRAHGFSEYVAGDTENVAEVAGADRMIAAAERFELLGVDRFMAIPGRDMIPCPEDETAVWDPVSPEEYQQPEPMETGDEWRKTVLAHYWKQASIRAFSMDTPTSVRVNLGEFSEDPVEDIEETIRAAKRFFSTVIVPGLPKQVQNIASMAAGVNCADVCTLYTAIEFDVSRNLYEGETLRIERPGSLEIYKLSAGELDFITEVSSGKTPDVVRKFFDRYRELMENQELRETEVPFMADYRVWYGLYCIDRIIKEKHAFINAARLMKEHGNPNDISDARACYLQMQQLRRILEKDHGLNNGNRRTLVTDLVKDLESGLIQVMLEDMNRADAKPFLLRKNEMLEFHHKTLYVATEEQVDDMISLAVRDALAYQAPQFIRCYPSTPIRNEQADERNARLMKAILPASVTPLIDLEIQNNREKIENKYLRKMGLDQDDDQFKKWIMQHARTNEAFCAYLKNEIRDANKHFLLYGITREYLPTDELFRTTMEHLEKHHNTRSTFPSKWQLHIASLGAKDHVAGAQADPECVSAMNRYYQACFREYRADIGSISETIIKPLGGDTTGAMTMIFSEYAEGRRISADEAQAVFGTFGGENGDRIREGVIMSYTNMLARQREKALEDPSADRKPLIQWLGSMIGAAPFDIDTSADMAALFTHAANGERMTAEEAKSVFETLDRDNRYARKEEVRTAYIRMISDHRTRMLEDPSSDRRPLIQWLGGVVGAAPFEIDTSADMTALFTHAANGERMLAEEAESIFTTLDKEKKFAQKEGVASAYSRIIAVHQAKILEDHDLDREAARESMVRWVANMVEKAPFDVDTSDSIRAAFEHARTGERMSRATAQLIVKELMPNASAGEDKVRIAFHNMIRDQLDAALQPDVADASVLEWISTMIKVTGGHITYDTTDVLKKIFESAKQGERMKPSDAGYVFENMQDKAEGLVPGVQRVYNEMLSVRRKEIVENADPDGFSWLCDMADRSPWSGDESWMAEQHTENVAALCEISKKTDTPIDSNTLNMLRNWLERNQLTPRGMTMLQVYCNSQLVKGDTVAVDLLAPHFGIIDGSCEWLRDMMFENAVKQYKDGLEKPDVAFGELVESCRGDVERSGKRLDELYRATEAETEEYLKRHFENTSDLSILSEEMEQIPRNSSFYSRWQEYLGQKVFGQQEEMFNAQPNLEKLIALKSDLLSRSGTLKPSLIAAYDLITGYQSRLEKLKDMSEYEALTSTGAELKQIRNDLQKAAPVRKKLCSVIRNVKHPVQKDLRDKSERHAFCAAVIQAMFTDTEREVSAQDGNAKVKGCPDWTRVLNGFFPKAELDEAIRKPYDPKNLPVLQRLLSMMDDARLMVIYGMDEAWRLDLEKTVHGHSDLHRYQSALARSRKMSEKYHLKFDTDGLVFHS